jgi:glycosyltransferase involved in cell wall biosynthesis
LDWLATAVTSCLANECGIEVLLVDDGCEVPLCDLLDDALRRSVRVVRIEHGGLAVARTVGVAHAKGEFVRFADCDDATVPGSLDALVHHARVSRSIVFGDTAMCTPELVPVRTLTSRIARPTPEDCVLGRFDARVTSLLFPREVAAAVGAFDASCGISDDWDFVLRALELRHAVREPVIVTLYRRHPSSMTGTTHVEDGLEARRRVIERYVDRHPDDAGRRVGRAAFARLHADAARGYAHRRRWTLAARHLSAGVRLDAAAAAAALLRR